MTIKELIEKLKTFDENSHIYVEGCDCVGFATTVEEFGVNKDNLDEPDGPTVIIRRKDGVFNDVYDDDEKR